MKFAGTGVGIAQLHAFFDVLGEPVLVFDRGLRLSFANRAALRLLGCEAGMPLPALRPLIGDAALRWLQQAALGASVGEAPPALLPDGRRAALAWQRLDAMRSALRLQPEPPRVAAPPAAVDADADALLVQLWNSPFPVLLQDAAFRMLDVNRACVEFTGYGREQLVGRDPLEFEPPQDRAEHRAWRERMLGGGGTVRPALVERRFIDADGRERCYRAAHWPLPDAQGRLRYLVLMQDCTGEHLARERADHSVRELDQWFDVSTVGMVLFDEAGLLLRTNATFEALTGTRPALLAHAPSALRALLGWGDGGPVAQLQPGGGAIERQGWLPLPGGAGRRLRAVVRCCSAPGDQRRFLGIVEDRSVEEERDLAQLQIGALMDTAGVGIATFQESVGWLRQSPPGHAAGDAGSAAALQGVGRELVLPESMPAFEQLQQALRRTERAQARYAIQHPELGQRWLLTRVEPATLASGQRTTSVVTLDITDQHESQQRSEQLLRELTTILESSPAGIAYVRGDVLVRCNRRFELMLGLHEGAVAGGSLRSLFGGEPQVRRIAVQAQRALRDDLVYETEFQWEGGTPGVGTGRPARWYALSVRRTPTESSVTEAIAVLSDITRLKLQQTQLEVLARDRELMFSLSDVGIAFVRHDRIERANAALARLTGQAVDELVGQPLAALLPPSADAERLHAEEERSLRVFGRWSGERQLRRRDGRLRWVQLSKRLVNEGDPADGLIAAWVDVDARHRAEHAVALHAERTRAVLDSVLVGIVTVGPRGIEWMNRSARRMFAGELGDFLNQPMDVVATPDPDHPFHRIGELDALPEGQAQTFECRVRARDGRCFWVVGNAVVTGLESGGRQVTYALLDIERRREAEARTVAAQSQLQRIIEAAPMAIMLLEAGSLKVLQVNDVAARSLRSTPAALAGRTPEQIFSPESAARRRADMERALTSPEVTSLEYRGRADGRLQIWDARCLPLGEPGQAPTQLLLVATDVTEQRAAQQAKFEAALAQREMLVKEVHHRIKNNLQGVAGLLQQIAARKPEVASTIAEVVGQVQAIAQVYGLGVGVTGALRLAGVVEAITGSVQRTFGRPIALALEGAQRDQWTLPEAEAIPIALTVNELLTNAIKHGGPGELSCRLACGDDSAQLCIGNPGRLPADFSLETYPGGVSGLGLVRALLPRRHARLRIEQQGERVAAIVELSTPVIRRIEAAA